MILIHGGMTGAIQDPRVLKRNLAAFLGEWQGLLPKVISTYLKGALGKTRERRAYLELQLQANRQEDDLRISRRRNNTSARGGQKNKYKNVKNDINIHVEMKQKEQKQQQEQVEERRKQEPLPRQEPHQSQQQDETEIQTTRKIQALKRRERMLRVEKRVEDPYLFLKLMKWTSKWLFWSNRFSTAFQMNYHIFASNMDPLIHDMMHFWGDTMNPGFARLKRICSKYRTVEDIRIDVSSTSKMKNKINGNRINLNKAGAGVEVDVGAGDRSTRSGTSATSSTRSDEQVRSESDRSTAASGGGSSSTRSRRDLPERGDAHRLQEQDQHQEHLLRQANSKKSVSGPAPSPLASSSSRAGAASSSSSGFSGQPGQQEHEQQGSSPSSNIDTKTNAPISKSKSISTSSLTIEPFSSENAFLHMLSGGFVSACGPPMTGSDMLHFMEHMSLIVNVYAAEILEKIDFRIDDVMAPRDEIQGGVQGVGQKQQNFE